MNSKTIIVVDDDKDIREGLEEFLQIAGYLVRTASNGEEGLKVIRELKGHCVVLLDLQMPVMSGQEMLRALEGDPDIEVQNVPVLIITAGHEVTGQRRERLNKPINLKDLLKKITGLSFSPLPKLAKILGC